MTKHDTWAKLKPNNPYEPIMDLFPDGMIPMRDPFGIERVTGTDGKPVVLWIVDLERLTSLQANAIAQLIGINCNSDATTVANEAVAKGGFAMNAEWIESMECGPEGFQRAKELADFLENAPQPPSKRAWREFYNSQHDRWIEGNEEAPPINSIENIEDIDPRLRTPELEERWKQHKIQQLLADSNYSVLDVLLGRANVDILNTVDPNHTYSLVAADDFLEDENTTQEDTESVEIETIEIHNVATIYGLNDDGSLVEDPIAQMSRPQDWGNKDKWHYEFFKLEWTHKNKHYINNFHGWTDIKAPENGYPQLFAGLITMILMPGTPPEFCGQEYLNEDDFWHPDWGEMPPYYIPSDDEYWEDIMSEETTNYQIDPIGTTTEYISH